MKIQRHPLLLIVSGPAGSGKTTLCDRMCAEVSGVERVVTSTTREPREGELDTVDYYFFDRDTFEKKVSAGDFYEHAKVHTNYYGTLKSEIQDKFAKGIDLLLNIDVQGAASFRQAAQEDPQLAERLITVFVMATEESELRSRLATRGTDDEAEINRRMLSAQKEMQEWSDYDYVIDSLTRDEDFDRLRCIYQAEKLRTERNTLSQ